MHPHTIAHVIAECDEATRWLLSPLGCRIQVDLFTFESEEEMWMAVGMDMPVRSSSDCWVREVYRAARAAARAEGGMGEDATAKPVGVVPCNGAIRGDAATLGRKEALRTQRAEARTSGRQGARG